MEYSTCDLLFNKEQIHIVIRTDVNCKQHNPVSALFCPHTTRSCKDASVISPCSRPKKGEEVTLRVCEGCEQNSTLLCQGQCGGVDFFVIRDIFFLVDHSISRRGGMTSKHLWVERHDLQHRFDCCSGEAFLLFISLFTT